jgi:hypothetical protein
MSELIVKSKGKYLVELVAPYQRFEVVVHKGFVFNGASIPRIFWTFFHPFQYLESSVIHDFLYDIAVTNYRRGAYTEARRTFKRADELFLKALKEDDPKVSRLFYNAVRLYRWFKFPKVG